MSANHCGTLFIKIHERTLRPLRLRGEHSRLSPQLLPKFTFPGHGVQIKFSHLRWSVKNAGFRPKRGLVEGGWHLHTRASAARRAEHPLVLLHFFSHSSGRMVNESAAMY